MRNGQDEITGFSCQVFLGLEKTVGIRWLLFWRIFLIYVWKYSALLKNKINKCTSKTKKNLEIIAESQETALSQQNIGILNSNWLIKKLWGMRDQWLLAKLL